MPRVFLGYNVTGDDTQGPTRILEAVEFEEEMTPEQLANSVELPQRLLDSLIQTGNEYLISESLVMRHLRTSGQVLPAAVG